jgi:nucleoside phosphorylase
MACPITLPHREYTVGWVCALPIELAASKAMLDEKHNPPIQKPGDTNSYTVGRIGEHNVVMTCLPNGVTGTASAAKVAAAMLRTFRMLRFSLLVGIGGGAPSKDHDIRLGDVVVSKPSGRYGGVIQYDFGKTVQGGHFTVSRSLDRPSDALLTALSNLEAEQDMNGPQLSRHLVDMIEKNPSMGPRFSHPGVQTDHLYESNYDHPRGNPTCSSCDIRRLIRRRQRRSDTPVVHTGLIASANQVMRHGGTRERLKKKFGILCFEMEAAGLMDAFHCLVIRGICDYADSHKNKVWQPYAAATAAAYAKELLYTIPREEAAQDTRLAAVNEQGTSNHQNVI